jgi:hypothetical protein
MSCGKAPFPAHIIQCASHRDHRLDLGTAHCSTLRLLRYPIVGKDSLAATGLFGQPLQLHRQELGI